MRKLIVVIAVVLFPLTALVASQSKTAAINQLLKLVDNADEPPAAHFEAFDRARTEAQVDESLIFLTSPAGRQLLAAMREMNAAQIALVDEASAGSKMKRTLADIRTLANSIDALATDSNAYPAVKTLDRLEKLVSPVYLLHMPRLDAWGHEYLYLGDAKGYRIVSGGPDGKITEASRKRSAKSGFGDDIVYEGGDFLAPNPIPE